MKTGTSSPDNSEGDKMKFELPAIKIFKTMDPCDIDEDEPDGCRAISPGKRGFSETVSIAGNERARISPIAMSSPPRMMAKMSEPNYETPNTIKEVPDEANS